LCASWRKRKRKNEEVVVNELRNIIFMHTSR
jgi:hypothetical protein